MELLEKYFAELIQCVDASYLVIGIILVFLSGTGYCRLCPLS